LTVKVPLKGLLGRSNGAYLQRNNLVTRPYLRRSHLHVHQHYLTEVLRLWCLRAVGPYSSYQ